MNLDEVLDKLKQTKSYLVMLTIRDEGKDEGNLTHYTFRKEFPVDDIIPSVDANIRSLGIKTPEVKTNPVVAPELITNQRPLKIAIITHFNRCPEYYSPGRAVKNQIKMLQDHGHKVVFFVVEGSELEMGCEIRAVIPKFKREKNVVNEEVKQKMIDVLREHLTADFDVAITHDLYIDDCITYRTAIQECNVNIQWLHVARSGVGKPIDFKMNNARYVYLNKSESERFAQQVGVDHSLVRFLPNEKTPQWTFNWDPITTMIYEKMKLWDKDIIQTYAFCTSRMGAKQVDIIIEIFGLLKGMGYKVGLILCNSNGRKRKEEINSKLVFAESCGLIIGEDVIFTSSLANEEFKIENEVPNKIVIQLMQISNLFILPTVAEVCSNIELESSMCKNLLVINSDLPALFDFVDEFAVLKYPFTSLQSLHYSSRGNESLQKLCKEIIGQLMSNKSDRQFRRVFREHNSEVVYKKYLEPILYEK